MTTPRVSLVLLVYNQRPLLEAAVRHCLAQECEPLEIVLSDDASSDGSFEAMQALVAAYRGPHHVRVRRNERNLGIGGHYNRLLEETRGELIVTAAGDDLSMPHRVQRLVQAWDASACKVDLLASHFTEMTADGVVGDVVAVDDLAQWNLQRWLQQRPFVTGATHAFTRRLMQHFGPFVEGLWYEDTVMVFRALALGGAVTVPAPLVQYRREGTSAAPASKLVTAAAHRQWVARQNQRLLAEMQQLLLDAERLGLRPAVMASLGRLWQREHLIRALLQASNWRQRWTAVLQAQGLAWSWRIRKALLLSSPVFAAASAAVRRWQLQRRGR